MTHMAHANGAESGKGSLLRQLPTVDADAFVLLNVFVDDVMDVNLEVLRHLSAQGYGGVYVTLSKDYLSVAAAMGAAGVDLRRIKFVDAASRMYGVAPVGSPDVVYVDGPLSVGEILDGIAAALRGLAFPRRFVLLDSLTTVSLYNSPEDTVAFGKALRKLLKKEGAAGFVVLAYRDAADKELLDKLKNGGQVIATGRLPVE